MNSTLIATGTVAPRPRRPLSGLNRIAYSPSGREVATGDVSMNVQVQGGGTVRFARNYESANEKVRPMDRVRGLRFGKDGSLLFIAAGDTVHAVEWASGREVWSYTAPRSFGFLIISPISLAVGEGGDVAVAFDNGSIAVWSEAGEFKCAWRDNESPRVLHFVADGSRLVGTDSFSLCCWDIATRKKIFRRRLPERAFGMAANGSQFMATRGFSSATLWNLDTALPILTVPVGRGLPVLELSPSSACIALATEHSVELIDCQGTPITRLEIQEETVLSLAFSPSGHELAVGGSSNELRILPMKASSAES